jgi:glycine cleavage system aminomethyltransferase T
MQTATTPAGRPVGRFLRPTPPGAMVVARDDGRSVTAHYGSVATEIAVCRKSVGLAFRTELQLLEVQGREPWLERLLTRALGRDPEVGSAIVAAGAWCCRVDAHHALVIGPSGAVERWRRVAREAVIGGSPITATDLTDAWAPMSLIGPRAARLLRLSGLPADLPPQTLHRGTLAGAPALLLRTGADHWLVLVDSDGATDACRALLDDGRSLGLTLVGSEAVGRLAAATRPLAAAV